MANYQGLNCVMGEITTMVSDARYPHDQHIYDYFTAKVREKGVKVGEGVFQAEMLVRINNDGPVTILLDSKKLF